MAISIGCPDILISVSHKKLIDVCIRNDESQQFGLKIDVTTKQLTKSIWITLSHEQIGFMGYMVYKIGTRSPKII